MYVTNSGDYAQNNPYNQQPQYGGWYQQPQQPMTAVPPVIDGYGNMSGPSTPGYHNISIPPQQNQFMNMGQGYNSYQYDMFSQPSQYRNQFFTGGSIYANQNNDPYQYHGNNPLLQQQAQQTQDRTIHVPGCAMSTNPLVTVQDIERVKELYNLMLDEQDEIANTPEQYNPYQYNYYGGASSFWRMRDSVQKFDRQVQEILNKAQERRLDWSKKMSRIAHHFLDDGVTEEDIDRMYDGYTYTVPASTVQDDQMYSMFYMAHESGMEVDPTNNPYYAHSLEVNYIYEQLCPPDSDMNTFFGRLKLVDMFYEYTAETSRRRNGQRMFNSNSYRSLIRKAIKDRKEMEAGRSLSADEALFNKIKKNFDPNASYDEQLTQASAIVGSVMLGRDNPNTETPFGTMLQGIEKYGHFENGVFTLAEPPWPESEDEGQMEAEYEKGRDKFIQSIYNKERR